MQGPTVIIGTYLITYILNFFQYLQDSTHYHERKTHQQDLALAEMKRYREIVVKELSDTKMKLHRAFAENKQLRHELEWKPENPPPPPPPPPPASLLRYYTIY